MMAEVYLALGSNLGDRAATLREAVARIGSLIEITNASSVYETDPIGGTDQPRYLNAVIGGSTALAPHELLARLQQFEDDLGRERPFPNAPRTLDLDLLFYDDLILDDPNLTLPHPRLHERFFVLVPLVEIAPDLKHPVLGLTASQILARLGEPEGIQPAGFTLRTWTAFRDD